MKRVYEWKKEKGGGVEGKTEYLLGFLSDAVVFCFEDWQQRVPTTKLHKKKGKCVQIRFSFLSLSMFCGVALYLSFFFLIS